MWWMAAERAEVLQVRRVGFEKREITQPLAIT
jgi:hypothetical protein